MTCEQADMLDQIFQETHLTGKRKTISVCYRLPIYNLHHKSMSDYFNAKCFLASFYCTNGFNNTL